MMKATSSLAVLLAVACGTTPIVPARWEARAPVPEGRTEASVATDGTLIYLSGGPRPGLAFSTANERLVE